MDNATDNLPVRKHLPHIPPVNVSQFTVGAAYFITICADRKHYGIVDVPVGRVVLNAPNPTDNGALGTTRPTNRLTMSNPTDNGALGTTRPTTPNIAPLTTGNIAVKILVSFEHYRVKGILFPRIALVMPDHVHLIVTFSASSDMVKLLRNWKRWIARETGIVWQDGFFDHRLRGESEVNEKLAYIEQNPVRKGLCKNAEDWPFRMDW